MSQFWKTYASVADDVRHKLVEEAWFGKKVTADINETDMPALGEITPTDTPRIGAGEGPKNQTINPLYAGPAAIEPTIVGPAIEAAEIEAPDMTPAQPEQDQGHTPEL